MGAFYLLPLSSLKMRTEQKRAAVELLLFFVRSGSELLLRRRHIKIFANEYFRTPTAPLVLVSPGDGTKPVTALCWRGRSLSCPGSRGKHQN